MGTLVPLSSVGVAYKVVFRVITPSPQFRLAAFLCYQHVFPLQHQSKQNSVTMDKEAARSYETLEQTY